MQIRCHTEERRGATQSDRLSKKEGEGWMERQSKNREE